MSQDSLIDSNMFRRNMLSPSSERCGKRASNCVRNVGPHLSFCTVLIPELYYVKMIANPKLSIS